MVKSLLRNGPNLNPFGTRELFIEVHPSNVSACEPFRRHSYLPDIAVGAISGLDTRDEELAPSAVARHLATPRR